MLYIYIYIYTYDNGSDNTNITNIGNKAARCQEGSRGHQTRARA